MKRETLDTLARLRGLMVEDAKRGLAACLAAEEAARMALDSAERTIIREQAAASALEAGDAAVEAFAAWLPRGRLLVAQAVAAHDAAVAATVQARAVLAAARAGAEAAEQLRSQRAAAHRQAAGRRAQAALDETARRRTSRP